MGGFIRTNAGVEQLGFVRGPAMIYAAPLTQAPPANIGDIVRLTGSSVNEVQTLTITGTPTGGTFRLSFKSVSTAAIAFNASAAAVQAALEAISTVGTGNVVATGGPLPATAVVLTFQGQLAGTNVPLITVNTPAFTGGTTPTATVAETTPGSGLYDPLGSWFPLGGTKNGVNPTMNNTEDEFTIDQQKVAVGVLPNEWTWTFTTSLVEVTPENLAFAWDMGPVTLNTLPAVPEKQFGFGPSLMPSYLYSQNVSARDRFTQIELQLDNGKVATLRQGNAYDLTATEVARARSFVTMVPSGSAPAPSGVAYLPIRGDLSDGDVPVWDSSIGAFVPGAGGGGGGNPVMVWN
jgi:hypothetical protein